MARRLVVFLAFAACAGVAVAASPQRERPALATSCGRIADYAPGWSPDGQWLLFTRVIDSGGVDSGIYKMRVDGKRMLRLTEPSEYAYDAVWSPDGSRVAYSTFDDAALVRIMVARADGTGASVLATFQGMREPLWTYLAWAPGGRELAYVADAVYVASLDGSGTRTIARGGTLPAWSPDGRRIAFWTYEDGLVVADASGAGAHVVDRDGLFPAWSPDGRIAYQARDRAGVTVLDQDGTKALVDRKGGLPRWSPDGQRIVDVHQPARGRYSLHVVDLRTGRVRPITHDSSRRSGADDDDPHFSPDGKVVAFTSSMLTSRQPLGGSELRIVRSDGRKEHRLTYHCAIVGGGFGAELDGTWLADVIVGTTGYDTIRGWGGDDTVYSRDRCDDSIQCGRGRDLVYADRLDRVAHDCETVARR